MITTYSTMCPIFKIILHFTVCMQSFDAWGIKCADYWFLSQYSSLTDWMMLGWWISWNPQYFLFDCIKSTQPPDDHLAPRLISRDVLQSQATASQWRRRSKASALVVIVGPMLPPPSCRGLYVQGGRGAIHVVGVAGDVGDVFVCGEFQSFFLRWFSTIACFAPRAPHIAVSEEESRLLIELFFHLARISTIQP